ncbi:MAG: hypothetical protein AAF411_20850, partial [Myxococcota bacterium]
WVMQNKLDRSLVFFDTSGKTLGAFFVYKRGDVTEARWNGIEINKISNTHIQQIIQSILSLTDSGLALSALLEEIDSSLWITDPKGESQKQGLSVLVGRPLVLARARVNLALKGEALVNQALDETGKKDSSDLLSVEFPSRIGAIELPDNGVIGYFRNQDYEQFNVLDQYQQEGDSPKRPPYIVSAPTEALKIGQRQFEYFTLLLDPRGAVHTTTGILPTFTLQLSSAYTTTPIQNMEITFRIGPLLTDPDTVQMPTPSDIHGQLSFTDQNGTNVIQSARTNAAFPLKRNQLKEGELTLKKE